MEQQTKHVFKKSLGVGALGETLFAAAVKDDYQRLDGRHGDFIHTDGHKLELKTDTYSMEATPNMFMERFSNLETKTPGGPFQANIHGCIKYAYMYIQDLTVFIFDTDTLIKRLEKLIPNQKPKNIPNHTWITQGYAINRNDLIDIAEKKVLRVKWSK